MRFLSIFILMFVASCGYAPHKDPALHVHESEMLTIIDAQTEAQMVHGYVTVDTCCGSMVPLIQDGDRLIVVPVQLDDNALGHVVSYRPAWAKGGHIAHRLVAHDADGFIASGDNNAHSEANERVTNENFDGVVVGIHRTKL